MNSKRLLSLLTAFAMVFSLAAMVQPLEASAATVDISIANSGFETGAFGGNMYAQGGAAIVDNKDVHSGDYAVHLIHGGENGNGAMDVTVYPEVSDAERTLTVSFWMMCKPGVAANSVHYGIFCFDSDWAQLSINYGAEYATVDGNWYKQEISLTAPANTKFIQVQLYTADAGTAPYLDDISVVLDGTELMTNGGLENGQLNGGISASRGTVEVVKAKPVHSGTYAAHADKATNGGVKVAVNLEPSAEERSMTFSFWAYAAEVDGIHTQVACFKNDGTDPAVSYDAEYVNLGVWEQKSFDITVPANTNSLEVLLYAGQEGADFYIDDVTLTETVPDVPVIHNSGFETGAFGGNMYAQGGAAIVDNKDVHSGNYAVHLIHGGENGNGAMDVTVYPEVSDAERTLKVSFWMMCKPNAAANSVHYGIFCFDSDWANLSSNYGAEYAAVDGNWYKQEISLTAPANTKFIQVQLYTADAGTAPYLDDISVVLDGTELMTNGGLENGQLNGGISSSRGTIEVVKAKPVHSGTYAAHADMATSGGIKTSVNLIPSAEERIMTFSFWAYAAEVNAIHTQVACFKNDGTDPAVSYDAEYVNLGVWEQKSFDITVPANTNSLEVLLYANQDGADFYIDDVALALKETPAEPENQNITVSLNRVDGDNWYLDSNVSGAGSEYYKMTALVDGAEKNVMLSCGENSLTVWANFFDSIPTTSFVIPANTVLVPISPDGGWHDIEGATLTITNGMRAEKAAGAWLDMSTYEDVTFVELTAADLNVYKTADQSEAMYRSTFATEALNGKEIGNSGWGNFTTVAAKVLVDGVETAVTFGDVPVEESTWGNPSALLLYVTGEGFRDAATTANTVTICAGTTLINPTDSTKGVKFTEDFTMYKNCDGTWDITADSHIFTENPVEAALASAANCQSAAVYYKSCVCGELSAETFTYGELGEHNYVDGTCDLCGDKQTAVNTEIAFTLHAVTGDGTWQFTPSAPFTKNAYYKLPVVIDGTPGYVAAAANTESGFLLIYPSFFGVFGASEPTASMEIRSGVVLNELNAEGWVVIENTDYFTTTNTQRVEQIGGKWIEMSQYDGVTYTEIHASDLDVYYREILRLGDITDSQINALKYANKALYNTAQEIIAAYGRQANRTTIGIKSVNPALTIPSDASWSNFTVLGNLIVNGADPADTYIAMTPNSVSGEATGMDNAFLLFFYNGYVLDNATSVTIPAGTRIIAKDGTTGFVFAEDYTVYRKCDTTNVDDYRKNQHTWNDTEGYHYPGQWTQTVAPAYKVPGQETTTCTKCGETLNREIPALTTPVTEWNVTLGENIGVSFILGLTGSETVTAAVNGVAVDAPVVDGVLYLNLPATQMADEIVISIDGEALAKTYSVRGYAEEILAGNYSEATKNLVKYMLSYGSAAQTYFGYNTENPADRGITVEAKTPTGDTTVDYSGKVSGIAFYSASLLHRNKTAVRFYFTGSAENLTFTVNGVACEPTAKDDMYYVELAGINPQELANDVTVVVSDGIDTLTVHYSPMDYIVRMYEKETSSPQTKALVQALYGYYLAAAAYTA